MPLLAEPTLSRHRLRRVKSRLQVSSNAGDHSTELISPRNAKTLARIILKSPWDDYSSIRQLGRCIMAKHKTHYFKIVSITQLDSLDVLQLSRILGDLQHANIASHYDTYHYESRVFLASEHLPICVSELGMSDSLREWEIATLFSEVWVNLRRQSCPDSCRCSRAYHILPPSSYPARISPARIFDCLWMER